EPGKSVEGATWVGRADAEREIKASWQRAKDAEQSGVDARRSEELSPVETLAPSATPVVVPGEAAVEGGDQDATSNGRLRGSLSPRDNSWPRD
ncbi:MAG: inorganic pyrophosphatase, partial [Pseudonocardia sp.]